jgi:hypothetical protein
VSVPEAGLLIKAMHSEPVKEGLQNTHDGIIQFQLAEIVLPQVNVATALTNVKKQEVL